ncbi:MAG TPA: galactokinase [Bacteroidales bacterium]|nr:galactokinase [Bacteroidales bacterium]HPT22123.1 galactokinase [Bacteroidales bacterium]
MDTKNFFEIFYNKFSNRDDKPLLFFSPGRVNLIGEHTDYNGGFVFPCALNYGTYLLIRKTDRNILRFSTTNFADEAEEELKGLFVNTSKKWINYPLGVINEFLKQGIKISGLEFLYSGDVPNGAGLSSSASIEMVTAVAINELFNAGFSTLDLVKMSQKAENEFVGMNCGIMDQFAVGFGKKEHAIFLNCDTLSYENVPVMLGDCSLIITNTNKRRGLTDSKYNERRSECDKAVELLQAYKPIRNLSELNVGEIGLLEKYIKDPVVRKRAKHVISENGRAIEAVKVLKSNNIIRFGELMNLSHDSLKDDYEVTGFELDTLVYEGRKLPGVIGTRMTGAGFGGCTVSIVKKSESEKFITELSVIYKNKTGLTADFYQPEIGDGAGRRG